MLLSIESRFLTRALGMTEPQYLSRGSALLVHNASKSQLALASCAHILHPFRFPHYYRDSMKWLGLVRADDVSFQMQLISPTTGEPLYELDLPSSLLKLHDTLDCGAFVFPERLDQARFLRQMSEASSSSSTVAAAAFSGQHEYTPGEVECWGFNYSGNRMEQQVERHDMVRVRGSTLSPSVEMRARRKSGPAAESDDLVPCPEFRVRSQEKLNFGMCGGPVVHRESGALLGMVEGIAPPDEQDASSTSTVHCLPTSVLLSLF